MSLAFSRVGHLASERTCIAVGCQNHNSWWKVGFSSDVPTQLARHVGHERYRHTRVFEELLNVHAACALWRKVERADAQISSEASTISTAHTTVSSSTSYKLRGGLPDENLVTI